MFNNLVSRFSSLATLYNNLVVAKFTISSEYYYDAYQTEQVQKIYRHDPYSGVDQYYSISTNITDDFVSVDKLMGEDVDEDFYVVGTDSGKSSAAATAAVPSIDNVLPSYSSASSLAHYAYNTASVVAENSARTAICGAVRSCNFVWTEKKHIEGFVQKKKPKNLLKPR